MHFQMFKLGSRIRSIFCATILLSCGWAKAQYDVNSFDPLALVSSDRKSDIAAEKSRVNHIQREINFLNELPPQSWTIKSSNFRGHDLLYHYRHKHIRTSEPSDDREKMDGVWRIKSTKILGFKFVAGAGYQSAISESDLEPVAAIDDIRNSTLVFAAPNAYARSIELIRQTFFVGYRIHFGKNGLAYSDLIHAAPYTVSNGRLCIRRGIEDCFVALRTSDGSAYLRHDSGPNTGLVYRVVAISTGDPIGLEKLSDFWSQNPAEFKKTRQ